MKTIITLIIRLIASYYAIETWPKSSESRNINIQIIHNNTTVCGQNPAKINFSVDSNSLTNQLSD